MNRSAKLMARSKPIPADTSTATIPADCAFIERRFLPTWQASVTETDQWVRELQGTCRLLLSAPKQDTVDGKDFRRFLALLDGRLESIQDHTAEVARLFTSLAEEQVSKQPQELSAARRQ